MRDTVLASGRFQEDVPAESGPADAARMSRLVSNHFDFIWRSMRRLGVAESGAEDAAQQVFLIASKKIGPVHEDRERRFLFAIALRVASAERRQRRRHPDGPSDEDVDIESGEPGPEELIDRKKARMVLDSILGELPLESRVVLVLHEMEDHTMAEIAKLLQLSPGTVASRLRRARELFDAALTRYRARSRRGRSP
jgi:RNA polymerase sigma-70 factor (ECF subfamily)